MGGWASNSQGDLTYDDARSEWGGAGTGRPRGDTEPLVWDWQRTRRAQTPPQTPPPTSESRLRRPPTTSSSSRALLPHQLAPAGPLSAMETRRRG